MSSKPVKKVSKPSTSLVTRDSESSSASATFSDGDGPSSSQESEGTRRSARSTAGVPPLDKAAYVFDLGMLRPNATANSAPSASFAVSSPANPIVLESSDSDSAPQRRRKSAKPVDPIESFSDDDDDDAFMSSLKGPVSPAKKPASRSAQPSKLAPNVPDAQSSSKALPFASPGRPIGAPKSGSADLFPQRQGLTFASTNAEPSSDAARVDSALQPNPEAASSMAKGSSTPSRMTASQSAAKSTSVVLVGSVPPAPLLSPSAATRAVSHTPLADAQTELPVQALVASTSAAQVAPGGVLANRVPETPASDAQSALQDLPPPPPMSGLFPIPVKGYVPPTAPPPVPPSVMPSPESPITSTVYWNLHHRMELLGSLRSLCAQAPFDTVRFILEPDDFTPTTFRGFIEYLASRVRNADFFRMALSAISEAFRGSPSRYTTENMDTLKANILISVGSAKNLEELVSNRPISSFTPMFLALFSPQCYPALLRSCGFGDPESLSLPRPPGQASALPALHTYAAMSQHIRPRPLITVIFALSAHFLNVCSRPLSLEAAGVLATRAATESLHEEDAFRLHQELLHFDAHTENRSNALARVQQLFTISQHVWLLSRDAIVATCTDGAIRLLFVWVLGYLPPESATWESLASTIAAATSSCTADVTLCLDDHRSTWFLMNLPIELASAWFLRHPQREQYYDAESFHYSPIALRRQYILGFLYALSCTDHLHDRPLPDDSILRFCIAHAGGVLQPNAPSALPFDERLVLVAPRRGFTNLIMEAEAPSNPILRFSLTPLSALRTAFQRHTALSTKLTSLPQAEHQRFQLVTVPSTPTLHSQARLLLPAVDFSPIHTFEPHVELAEIEDNFRTAYALQLSATNSTATHRALVGAGLQAGVKAPPAPVLSSQDTARAPAPAVPSTDHSVATGMFASLLRVPQHSEPASFMDFLRATQAALHTLPHREASAQEFLAHVHRSTTSPSVGDLVVVPAVTSTCVLSLGYHLSWQELFAYPQACYRVSTVSDRRFTAAFMDIFYAAAGSKAAPWPPSVCLPTPCERYPELFVLRSAPAPTAIPSAPTNSKSGDDDDTDVPSFEPQPVEKVKHSKSRRHRRKKRRSNSDASDSSSSDSSSSSSESSSASSLTRRVRPSSIEDDAGISVTYTKSNTLAQVRDTTAWRVLLTDKSKPAADQDSTPWLDQIFRDSGNRLNNYTVDCITTGVFSIWRQSFRSLPHNNLTGAVHMHPPVSQLAWYAYRHTYKELALNVIFFNWIEFHSLTPTSLRLAHFLPLERLRQLPHNELATWDDFTMAIHGLQKTYGIYYCPVYDKTFHSIHDTIVSLQLGGTLSPRFLELWFLDLLAFIRRAARDPRAPVVPTDKAQYPAAIVPNTFSPADWCALLLSEFHARMHMLTLANDETFTRSMSFPVEIFIHHPFGKFQENGKSAAPNTRSALPPAPAPTGSRTAPGTQIAPQPTPGRGKGKGKKKERTSAATSSTGPAPTTTPSEKPNRICVYSFCNAYKIPLKARGTTPGAVPGKCSTDCPFLHAQDFPSGTSKNDILKRIQGTVEKILDRPQAEEFLSRFNNDNRFA